MWDRLDQAKLKLIGEDFGGTILHQFLHVRDGAHPCVQSAGHADNLAGWLRTRGCTHDMLTTPATWSISPRTRSKARAFMISSSTSLAGSLVSCAMSVKEMARSMAERLKVISMRQRREIFWRNLTSWAAKSGILTRFSSCH